MRPGVFASICLFLCAAFAASAQEQPDVARTLQTRNVNVAPVLFQNKSYLTGSTFGGTRGAEVNTFYFVDHVRTREFLTHSLYGQHKYWAGDFKYDTTTTNNNHTFAVKPFETKTVDTKAASESGKESATKAYATGEYRGRGKSQDRFDKEGSDAFKGPVPIGLGGDMHQMTMEEVRDLLNKNK